MWSSKSPEHGKYDEHRELRSGQELANGTSDSWSSFRCKTCRLYKTDTVREIPTFVGHSLAHEKGPKESSARSLPCSFCRYHQIMWSLQIFGIPKIGGMVDWIAEFEDIWTIQGRLIYFLFYLSIYLYLYLYTIQHFNKQTLLIQFCFPNFSSFLDLVQFLLFLAQRR